ncbi:hypothetical protein P691DRAFT_648185, partial [Macrolepiota fuliginosa MF-IS2]
FMFAYASVVMICGIVFLALNTWMVQLSYIDHNTFPGAAEEYEVAYLFTRPGGITEGTFNIIIDVLTLGIQIWRLWVIYSTTRYAIAVIILPILLFLCYTGASEASKQYMGIVAMLIESYALESIWTIAALISELLGNGPAGTFFASCDPAIEIIAYLLVIYRV